MVQRRGSLEKVGGYMLNLDFYRGKRVLVTGHTGFKGSWLCTILKDIGAEVTGYSLDPPTEPSLFEVAAVSKGMNSVIGDVCDFEALKRCISEAGPEMVFHLAAQPIVRDSYKYPRETYETNVMGTVNLLEAIRESDCVRSVVNVTTDKVYENKEWAWGYREYEHLKGFDPYSNSKSCSELVTYSYNEAFFRARNVAVSTARAGNVIGGGDFAKDRILPDCVRAALDGNDIIVRNPHSTRPYQHVLESVMAYLLIAEMQYNDKSLAGCYNVGPNDSDCLTTLSIVELFCKAWGEGIKFVERYDGGPHEANFLKLDCSKLKATFEWSPVWSIEQAVIRTVEWSKCMREDGDVIACMRKQSGEYVRLSRWISGGIA